MTASSTYAPTMHAGTIVGMPAFVPNPSSSALENATTMRSVAFEPEPPAGSTMRPPAPEWPVEWTTSEPVPVSDPFHPERWSTPPPEGLAPIVPCDEPDEDDVAKVLPAVSTVPPPPAPTGFALDEPVELPFGHRAGGDSLRLVVAAGLALVSLSGIVAAALFAI